jgi:SAM-dependent methyltransferase
MPVAALMERSGDPMQDPSREIFDHYQANYERRGGAGCFRSLENVQRLRLGRLPRWLGRIPKQARILDAGCATGYQLGLLHGLGYEQLVGVDLSTELTATARQRLPADVPIHCADIQEFLAGTPDASFDLILFHHVIEHIPREHTISLLREFRRCLAPGGSLDIKTPNAACLLAGYHVAGDITHITQFNEFSMIQAAEQAGFSADELDVVLHSPQLFWSWLHPLRTVFRMLNRIRWMLNRWLHRVLCVLMDLRPAPRCLEWELEVLIKK